MAQIIPGVLTNDEEDYQKRLKKAEHVASLIQIDVIDGKFAPNTTIGTSVIRKYPSLSLLEVQLIVKKPKEYIDDLVDLDFVSRIIFPFESDEKVFDNLYLIKSNKKQAGISINPETKVTKVADFMDDIDILCIFSASPGFSGMNLEDAVYGRIQEAKKINPTVAVEIDVGVNLDTAPKLVRAGADFLVATSALHNAPDYQLTFEKLAQVASSAR